MKGRVSFLQQAWFKILFVGLILFGITDAALFITNNVKLASTVILLGACLVPVTFVVYLHDRFQHMEMRLSLLASVFLFGGILGVVVAAIVEWKTLRSLSLLSLFWVGLVEESAKLLIPIFILVRGKYRHEVDGLLIGVACGMGFATLETMGYGMDALISANGSVGALDGTLLVRGLLSPAGHAAWTGYVCAVIWGEQEKGKHRLYFNRTILTAFIVAVILHATWDAFGSITSRTSTEIKAFEYIGLFVVALISLVLLARRTDHAQKNQRRSKSQLLKT